MALAKEYGWSKYLHKLRVDCEYVENDHDADYIRQDILNICNGKCPFSESMLYSNGENLMRDEKFTHLRIKLSSIVKKQKTKKHKERW